MGHMVVLRGMGLGRSNKTGQIQRATRNRVPTNIVGAAAAETKEVDIRGVFIIALYMSICSDGPPSECPSMFKFDTFCDA